MYCPKCVTWYLGPMIEVPMICPKCGTCLEDETADVSLGESPVIFYCEKCQNSYVASQGQTSMKCPDCGGSMVLVDGESEEEEAEMASQQSASFSGLTFWGVALVVLGIIGIFVAGPHVEQFRTGWGQLAAELNSSAASERQIWQGVYYGSFGAIVLGALLFLGGIIQSVGSKR